MLVVMLFAIAFHSATGGEQGTEPAPVAEKAAGDKAEKVPEIAPVRDPKLREQEKRRLAFSRSPAPEKKESAAAPTSVYLIPLLYLLLVGGGLWLSLYMARRYLPGGNQLFATPAVEVLGRTHLDPRRYLALVRIGRRLILVGVTPDGMAPITEINDEREIAEILEASKPKNPAGVSLFKQLFHKHLSTVEQKEKSAEADNAAEVLGNNISELRQRVRDLREQE